MVEAEMIETGTPARRPLRFDWLLSIFIRPVKALREIGSAEKQVWLLPMLLLTVLTLVSVFVAGPLRLQAAQNAPFEPPDSFQWMTPEQQQQYMAAQQSMNGPATIYLFPVIGALTGVWLGWFLLGSIMHLLLTLFGSRSTNTSAYNLAAWASMPFAIRLIVQIIAMLTTHRLIASPGISGFITGDVKGVLLYIQNMLRSVDLYLIWQIVLLWIGAAITSGLARGKAFAGVLLTVLILLILAALPRFLSAQLSGLNVGGSFIFF